MACCNCCCEEGEECCHAPGEDGICCDPDLCCGTPEEPVCCSEGQFCCDGVCQDEPCCPCACPNPCGYVLTAAISALGTTAEAQLAPTDCSGCNGREQVNVDTTPPSGLYAIIATPNNGVTPCSGYACAQIGFLEEDAYNQGATTLTVTRALTVFINVSCAMVDGVASWRVTASWSLQQNETTQDSGWPYDLVKQVTLSRYGEADVVAALESCGDAPGITISAAADGVTVNGTLHAWTTTTEQDVCQEWINGVQTTCNDVLTQNNPPPATLTLAWSGDCPTPCETPPP